MCILCMLRKPSDVRPSRMGFVASEINDTVPPTDLSMRASRGALRAVSQYLQVLGTLQDPESLSFILGIYRAHMAYAHLAGAMVQDPAATTSKDDMLLLQHVSLCIERIAKAEMEFVPLAQAMKYVNSEIKSRMPQDLLAQISGDA